MTTNDWIQANLHLLAGVFAVILLFAAMTVAVEVVRYVTGFGGESEDNDG